LVERAELKRLGFDYRDDPRVARGIEVRTVGRRSPRLEMRRIGRPRVPRVVPKQPATLRKSMKKAPQLSGSARLQMIAGAGLEPATPAL
jgi:hypothetical protein